MCSSNVRVYHITTCLIQYALSSSMKLKSLTSMQTDTRQYTRVYFNACPTALLDNAIYITKWPTYPILQVYRLYNIAVVANHFDENLNTVISAAHRFDVSSFNTLVDIEFRHSKYLSNKNISSINHEFDCAYCYLWNSNDILFFGKFMCIFWVNFWCWLWRALSSS